MWKRQRFGVDYEVVVGYEVDVDYAVDIVAALVAMRCRGYRLLYVEQRLEHFFSILAAFLISAVFVFTAAEGAPAKVPKKQKKAITKKGW